MLHQLLARLLGVGVRQVALVDGHHDGTARGLGVVDGFDGLRHHAVGGGHHQHHEIGHLRAARAHLGESGVAGRVDEGQRRIADLDLVRTDVLRDPAGLAFNHVGLSQSVEDGRLAVIHVAHDGDDRGTQLRVLSALCLNRLDLVGARAEELVFLETGVDDFEAHLAGEIACGLDVHVLVHRDHRAEGHQFALQLCGLDAEGLCELTHRDLALDPDAALLIDRCRDGWLRGRRIPPTGARVDGAA